MKRFLLATLIVNSFMVSLLVPGAFATPIGCVGGVSCDGVRNSDTTKEPCKPLISPYNGKTFYHFICNGSCEKKQPSKGKYACTIGSQVDFECPKNFYASNYSPSYDNMALCIKAYNSPDACDSVPCYTCIFPCPVSPIPNVDY